MMNRGRNPRGRNTRGRNRGRGNQAPPIPNPGGGHIHIPGNPNPNPNPGGGVIPPANPNPANLNPANPNPANPNPANPNPANPNPANPNPANPNPANPNPANPNPANPNPANPNPANPNPANPNPGGGGQNNGFLQWLQGVNLFAYKELYFGDPAVISTGPGCLYLRSAYCFFIEQNALGNCWGGHFTDQDFLSVNGLFSMTIPPHQTQDPFPDLLVDLVALGNSLLVHYRDRRGVPALFTDHLHYIITTPPPSVLVAGAIIFQARFKLLIRYHFSYAPIAAVRALFSSLAKAINYLGHHDAHQLHLLLRRAGSNLQIFSISWRDYLKRNPLFHELLMMTDKVTNARYLGYRDTPESLFTFGRNDEVHAPENTLLLTPVPQVQATAPPRWACHRVWTYNRARAQWHWAWKPAQGLWNWPRVPIEPRWKILWGNAAQNLNANAPAATYKSSSYNILIEQQMADPNQPSLMLAKMLGVFFAHASSLILIELQSATTEYIDLPYEVYRSLVDLSVPLV